MTNMFGPMKIDNILEPTLKSLTSFNLRNKPDPAQSKTVDQILKENKLEKITVDAKYSLFGAISVCMYLTEKDEKKVIRKVKDQLLNIFASGDIPLRLYSFKNNRKLLNDFLNKPYHTDYQKVLSVENWFKGVLKG